MRSNFARRFYAASHDYDLIVVGGGPGGYVAAIKAAQLGLKTACVESRGSLGGTCLNVGCIPSKALLHNSHLYHSSKTDFSKRGIVVPSVSLNLKEFMAYKDKTVTQLTKGIEYLFKKNKVDYLAGFGSLTTANSVHVKGSSIDKTVSAKNILIASGSEVSPFPGLTIDEQSIVSSTGALSFAEVPKKLVVIGGGIIGLELGSVWSRLGSAVTVVEYMPSIGAGMDGATASAFHKMLQKQGISFRLGSKVTGVQGSAGAHTVSVQPASGSGASETLEASAVLVSVGRRPFTKGLGLDTVGVTLDDRGRVSVDDQFRTNVPSIRAIGDVIAGPMLAHKAEEEGIAAVESIVSGKPVPVHYNAIPSVIYTHPEVAWVGLSEEQCKSKNVPYIVTNFPMLANSRAKTSDDFEGFVKIIRHKETDELLGAHIIGSNAGEMIAEAVIGIHHGIPASKLGETCHAHPSLSEAFKEACMHKPIHF